LATEAATALLDYGFRVFSFARVISVAQPANRASIRVMEKLGLHFDRNFVHNGIEVVSYAIDNPHTQGRNPMGIREPKEVMRRWFEEVWNQRRDPSIDELLHPAATAFGWGEDEPGVPTPELFRRFQRKFCALFPDLKVHIAHMVAEGDDVAMRLECEGHYAHAPADARPVRFGAMVFACVRDGQIVDGWNLVDESAMAKGIAAARSAE
jgi:ketosteroid isomerase-like protein